MRWLYNVDLFFWNIQKVSTLIIVSWLLQHWWRRYRQQDEERLTNIKIKEFINRFFAKIRSFRS